MASDFLMPHFQAFYTYSFWSLAVTKGEGLGDLITWSVARLSVVVTPHFNSQCYRCDRSCILC